MIYLEYEKLPIAGNSLFRKSLRSTPSLVIIAILKLNEKLEKTVTICIQLLALLMICSEFEVCYICCKIFMEILKIWISESCSEKYILRIFLKSNIIIKKKRYQNYKLTSQCNSNRC